MFGRKKAENEPIAVYCSRCGNGVTDRDAKFCNRCGSELYISGPAPKAKKLDPVVEEEIKKEQAPMVSEPEPVVNPKQTESTSTKVTIDLAEIMREIRDEEELPKKTTKKNDTGYVSLFIKQLFEGFNTGKLEESNLYEDTYKSTGWGTFNHDNTAFIHIPCAYNGNVSFRMMVDDRKVNKLDHGGPERGVIIHHNIADIEFNEGAGHISFYDGVEGPAFKEDNKNVFTFYLKAAKAPKAPCGPVADMEQKIKELTDGFRKGKLEGWDVNDDGGEASIMIPCFGGYIDFTLRTENRQINRLRCFRSDCNFVLNNIVTIRKGGIGLTFDDGIVDPRISPNHANFVNIIMKKTLAE